MKSTNVQPTTEPAIVGNNVLSAAADCHVRYWYAEIEKNKWSNLSGKARLEQLEHLQRCLDKAKCSCGGCR